MGKRARAIVISTILTAVIAAGLLAITAFILSKMETLPKSMIPVLTTIVSCAAVFLGAFSASLQLKERGIVNGLIIAFLFSSVVLTIAFFTYEAEFGLSGVSKLAAVFISGILGGVLGVNRKNKVKF